MLFCELLACIPCQLFYSSSHLSLNNYTLHVLYMLRMLTFSHGFYSASFATSKF